MISYLLQEAGYKSKAVGNIGESPHRSPYEGVLSNGSSSEEIRETEVMC